MPEFPKLVQRLDLIKALCQGKSVLHLGCANYPYTEESMAGGTLLHADLTTAASELYGFDFDQPGIDILAREGYTNLFRADLENLDAVPLNKTFDVIVAGEVIEHLNNPGLFLHGIQRFMHPATDLLITTVNAYSGLRFLLYALRGNKGVNEPVHPDHVYYFSYRTLRLLVERSGLVAAESYFYDLGKEHRVHNPWYYNFANDAAVALSSQLADGVIVRCRRPQDGEDGFAQLKSNSDN